MSWREGTERFIYSLGRVDAETGSIIQRAELPLALLKGLGVRALGEAFGGPVGLQFDETAPNTANVVDPTDVLDPNDPADQLRLLSNLELVGCTPSSASPG